MIDILFQVIILTRFIKNKSFQLSQYK